VTFLQKLGKSIGSLLLKSAAYDLEAIRQNTPPDEREVDWSEGPRASLRSSERSKRLLPTRATATGGKQLAKILCLTPILMDALDLINLTEFLPVLCL
jgi:hypothetical protein